MPKDLIAFFDGGQRYATGEMLSGFWISDSNGTELVNSSIVREIGTTNQAEFRALIGLLATLFRMVECDSTIHIYGDSQVLINSLNKLSKIKHPNLKPLYDKARELLTNLEAIHCKVLIHWIPRKGNKAADYLAQIRSNGKGSLYLTKAHDCIHLRLATLKAKDLKGIDGTDNSGREKRGKVSPCT